ncbi:MAG: heterodisulfide reductase-related iron-sulfur binding cluster [Promethearchaeota archaeon]|jgi:Fe-S oxidoreductase
MKERIKGRKNYPTDEVDPVNFLSDDEIRKLMREREEFRFSQNDFKKLYNCVHCGECETENERFQLKQKYIEDGNTFNEVNEMIEYFEKYRSPYPSNKMRIKRPKGIPKESDTLFFMGCLSTIRIPKYTEHALQYLLNQNVNFTILEEEVCCGWHLLASGLRKEYEICKKENIEIFQKFNKIICLCPACYDLFRKDYTDDMEKDIKVEYVIDYLKPSETQKSGKVGIQHLCQLMNRGRESVDKFVNNILEKSGYQLVDVPHWCCGGGSGYMGRTDVIDAIAKIRMKDFDKAGVDFATTYCPSCWWILRRYSKLCKIQPKVKDLFELLL